jgi:hypothetical protein
VIRYVVAHPDPGVPNWLDTTGIPRGLLSLRWTYSEDPATLPQHTVRTIPLAELREQLPADTRTVSPDERAAGIAIRQRHVQRRYRQY